MSAQGDSPVERQPGTEGQSGPEDLTVGGSQFGNVIIKNAKTILEYDGRPSVRVATADHVKDADQETEWLTTTIQKLKAELLQVRGQMSRMVETACRIKDPSKFLEWINDQG